MDDGADTASSGGMKMRRLEESSTVLRCDAFGLVHLLHFFVVADLCYPVAPHDSPRDTAKTSTKSDKSAT